MISFDNCKELMEFVDIVSKLKEKEKENKVLEEDIHWLREEIENLQVVKNNLEDKIQEFFNNSKKITKEDFIKIKKEVLTKEVSGC